MTSESQTPASSKMLWAGYVVSGIVVLGLVASGVFKLLNKGPDVDKELSKIGWKPELMLTLAILEIGCALIYAVPQTAFLGAILLTGYLGGAVATHVRIEDGQFFAPVIGGVLVWLGLFLREPRLRALVPWRS